jgi:hypothetical protein
MTLDGYPVKFGTGNTAAMWLTTSNTLGLGTSLTYGAKFAVLGGAVPTSSVGVAISSQLTAGRLTTGNTNATTGYIGNFLDDSITELSAGSSGVYTSGIVAFGGTAVVNPNTVGLYTAGTLRAQVTSAGVFTAGTLQTTSVSSFGSFSASKWFIQSEDTSNIRAYFCGPNTSTYGIYTLYNAKSNGTPLLVFQSTPTLTTIGVPGSSANGLVIDTAGRVMINTASNDGRFLTIVGTSNTLCGVGITYSGVAAASISVNSSGSLLFNLNNSDGTTERARIESSGLFNAISGSYSDVSFYNTSGLQISEKATYSDNSAHQFNNIDSRAGMVHIRATGLASIPFYPNAGGGVAYQWTVLNPQTGTWAVGAGPTVNFTENSSSPNSYSVVFNGGGGSFTITRTGGTTAYTVAVQKFAST